MTFDYTMPAICRTAHCILGWLIAPLFPVSHKAIDGIDLLIGHREQFIISFHVWIYFHCTPLRGRSSATLRLQFGKLKALSKMSIIGCDTLLTVSSLFTHAHYFCLDAQWSSFSSAGGDAAHHLTPRQHTLSSRRVIWQQITTTTQFTSRLADKWVSLFGMLLSQIWTNSNALITEDDLHHLLISC